MVEVKVKITNRDRKIGAMAKALAVEVAGFQAVSGATKEFLEDNGFYIFNFPDIYRAEAFINDLKEYIPQDKVQAEVIW